MYAGVGSRKAPNDILEKARLYAVSCHDELLRSGGADGLDSAFYAGATNRINFLPWRSYHPEGIVLPITDAVEKIARRHHPAYDYLTQGARKMMCRNVYVVLGPGLKTPVDRVVYWTSGSGGTRHTLSVAKEFGIGLVEL